MCFRVFPVEKDLCGFSSPQADQGLSRSLGDSGGPTRAAAVSQAESIPLQDKRLHLRGRSGASERATVGKVELTRLA